MKGKKQTRKEAAGLGLGRANRVMSFPNTHTKEYTVKKQCPKAKEEDHHFNLGNSEAQTNLELTM